MFPCSAWISHCSRVTPYGEIYLGQHWLGYWLVAWRHQAIIWTIFYLYSEKPSDRHPKDTSVINLYNEHKNILSHNLSKFSFKSSSDQWVNLGSIVSSHASQDNEPINLLTACWALGSWEPQCGQLRTGQFHWMLMSHRNLSFRYRQSPESSFLCTWLIGPQEIFYEIFGKLFSSSL